MTQSKNASRTIEAISQYPRHAASTILSKFTQTHDLLKDLMFGPSVQPMDLSDLVELKDREMFFDGNMGAYKKSRDPRFYASTEDWSFQYGENNIDMAFLELEDNDTQLKIGFPAKTGQYIIISYENKKWSTMVITTAP